MEKTIEKVAGEVIITITCNGDEWKLAQKKVFNKLSAKLKVPGFRQGKIPQDIAKRYIDAAQVLHDALYDVANKGYAEVLEAEKLAVISQPVLDVKSVSADEVVLTVTVALPPVVTLGEYKGIHVEKDAVEVTEEDINAEINRQLNAHASLVVKESAANLNDTVIIDFKGYVDGIPFDGGEAKGHELKLGSNTFIPGFEDQLVGISAGESRTIEVTFPENYVASLAGKTAKFDVVCHDVKETVVPTLDEEFVSELELKDITTIEQYKEKLSADILNRKTREADNKHLNTIVETIINNSEVEIGASIVDDEAKAMIDQIKKQIESNGLVFEDYLKINNVTEEQLLDSKRGEARNNLKGMLVISEICRKENIEVDASALNAKYEEIASMYGMKIDDVRKALEPNKNELLRNLKNELFTKFILANND